MPSTYTRVTYCTAALIVATLASIAPAGDPVSVLWTAPALDRWMYPFNATPGLRPTISTFGSTPGAPEFDSRDGQMLIGFDVAGHLPPAGWPTEYNITAARVVVQLSNSIATYDNTLDAWQCFVAASDPEYQADPDPGQPVELHGVGYRGGFTLQTFVETSQYGFGSPLAQGVRNAFALGAGSAGGSGFIDISNSPRDRFDPQPWAIGQVPAIQPGSLLTQYSLMQFDINLAAPGVLDYLRASIDGGSIRFALSSFTSVVQGGGNFPAFYAKENVEVALGIAQAAQLELSVTPMGPCGADIDCSGNVGGSDLALLLSGWGQSGQADIDGNGVVEGTDLSLLLSNWGG